LISIAQRSVAFMIAHSQRYRSWWYKCTHKSFGLSKIWPKSQKLWEKILTHF